MSEFANMFSIIKLGLTNHDIITIPTTFSTTQLPLSHFYENGIIMPTNLLELLERNQTMLVTPFDVINYLNFSYCFTLHTHENITTDVFKPNFINYPSYPNV